MQNTEIERKFLVKSLPDELEGFVCHDIIQCYISTDPTIRIRRCDNSYILTVKGSGLIKRTEYELPLTSEQFTRLRKKAEGGTISKKRYIIPLDGSLRAELDIYTGDLSGFMNVEVEFGSEREALVFTPPDWFGQEITQDKRYSNASLSKFGVPNLLQS